MLQTLLLIGFLAKWNRIKVFLIIWPTKLQIFLKSFKFEKKYLVAVFSKKLILIDTQLHAIILKAANTRSLIKFLSSKGIYTKFELLTGPKN